MQFDLRVQAGACGRIVPGGLVSSPIMRVPINGRNGVGGRLGEAFALCERYHFGAFFSSGNNSAMRDFRRANSRCNFAAL